MSLPLPVANHRKTLFLSFSPKCLPLAEVACYRLLNQNLDFLKVGLARNLLNTSPTLAVPKGKYSDANAELNGKPSILRFIAQASPLYPETISDRLAIDSWLDSLRNAKQNDKIILKRLETTAKEGFLVANAFSIADLMAWDYLSQHKDLPKPLKEWAAHLENAQELKEAKALVHDSLATASVLDVYKFHVVEQIAKLTGLDAMKVYSCIITPKSKDKGDIAISLHALKLPGNPMELGKSLVEKVHLLLPT